MWWDTLTAWGKALAAMCGLGEKVVAEIHDSKQRQAGANEQAVSSLTETVKAAENVSIIHDRNAGLDRGALVDKLHEQTGAKP